MSGRRDLGTVGVDADDGYDAAELAAALSHRTGFVADEERPDIRVVFSDDFAFVAAVADRTAAPVVCATSDPATARALSTERAGIRVVRWDRDAPPWSFLDAALRGAAENADGGTRDSALVRYEQLMDTIGDAVYALDDRGRFTYVNESLCELADLPESALLGAHVSRIKDDDTVERAEEALRELLRGDPDEQVSLEVDIVRDDGERIPCEDRMTLLPYEEEFRGTVGTLRDISAQKRREEMFDGLIETTQRMMAAERPSDIAEAVVDAATETLGRELTTVRFLEDGELVPVANSTATEETLPERPTYDPEEGPVGEAFTTGEALVRRAEEIDDDRDRGDVRAGHYLPLGEHGTVTLGTVAEVFDDQDRYFAELLASIATTALDRASRRRELRRYEAVVEAVDDMVFAVDERGRFRVVTSPFASAVGYEPAALIGAHVSTVGGGVLDPLVEAVEGGESVVREGELSDSDGESFPVRASAAPVSLSDFEGAVVSVTDISDLLSAREEATRQRDRFSELFDNLTDPVVELELDDGVAVVGANDAFRRVCGRAGTSLAGRSLDALRGTPAGDEIADRLAAVGTNELSGTELSVGTDDTRHYALREVNYGLPDTDRAFVVFTDVTALKRRETHLQVLNRVFRHNLRNDMNVVVGFASEIADRADGETATYATRILQRAERLVSLSETAKTIQEVLGAGTAEKAPRSLASVLESAAARAEREFPDADVVVDAARGASVRADERLSRAVYELVENAITHDDAARPTVRVRGALEGDETVIRVADDGPGIPSAEWEVVASEREITQLEHGSGLGLWLVRWIVEAHGGSLDAETGEDGTTVTVRLPR